MGGRKLTRGGAERRCWLRRAGSASGTRSPTSDPGGARGDGRRHRPASPTARASRRARCQLYSYELTGTVTDPERQAGEGRDRHDADGRPQVLDVLGPTGANGKYTSFLVAADQEGDDPVPMAVAVSVGANAYTEPVVDSVNFAALQSSKLDIQLPPTRRARRCLKSVDQPAGDPGRTLPRPPRGRRRRQGPRDQAGERELAGRERPLRARAALVRARARRQVLGERAAVLLHLSAEARRGTSTPRSTRPRLPRTLHRRSGR